MSREAVEALQSLERCAEPALADLITPYCFGDITDTQRTAFEIHLLECSRCWQEVVRLERAVRALRTDRSVALSLTTREVPGLLGVSAALERPLGGHAGHAIAASSLFGLLFAIPVLVEVAYRWDLYERLALWLAPSVFAWMLVSTLLALWVEARAARRRHIGLVQGLSVMVGAAAVLSAVLMFVLPRTPTVEAAFQTYPVHLGFLKSAFYALLVGPVFVVWPFHFVLATQRELQRGAHRQVLALLSGDRRHVPPRGVLYPRLWILGLYFAVLFVFHWVGVSHLFDNLHEREHANLFRALVMVRVGLSLILPALCLWWYATALNELRRECLAVISFSGSDNR